MSNEFLQGEWVGFYTYGEMYGPGLKDLKAGFEMKLRVDSAEFSGTCTDDDMKGKLDTPANIKGNFQGTNISFTKQYPFFFGIDQRGNVIRDDTKTPPVIEYIGHFDAHSGLLSGIWQIKSMELIGRDYVEKIFSGNWQMQKKN